MNNLKAIIDLMSAEAQQIEARAMAEKNEFGNQLINGIKLAFCIGDNDNSEPPPPTTTPSTGKITPPIVAPITKPPVGKAPRKAPGGKRKFNDQQFIDALTTTFQKQAEIAVTMARNGITISVGSIRNNLERIIKQRPDLVEQSADRKWKIKGQDTGDKSTTKALASAKKAAISPKFVKVGSNNPAARFQKSNRDQLIGANDQLIAANDQEIADPIFKGLHHGDCLDVMKRIPTGSVDLIATDPPFGTTYCKWDKLIDQNAMWVELQRIIKPTGVILLFGSQMSIVNLINGAPDLYKYDLIWEKECPTGHITCNNKPMKIHETIAMFTPGTTIQANRSNRRSTYNPGAIDAGIKQVKSKLATYMGGKVAGVHGDEYMSKSGYPTTILSFPRDKGPRLHDTQKPVALMEKLIEMYSNPGEVVLDFTVGSGTTAVAAINTDRNWIAIEKDAKYYEVADERINRVLSQKGQRSTFHE